MIKLYNFDELRPEEILNRDIRAEKNVEDVVDGIIAEVRARGDEALKEYALKFDGAKIDDLQVTQAEIDEAFANMDPYFLETLREAAANIESFHRQQVHKNFVINEKPGIVLGQKYTPIEKAGVYVPGGTAAYPSTVLAGHGGFRRSGQGEGPRGDSVRQEQDRFGQVVHFGDQAAARYADADDAGDSRLPAGIFQGR